LVIPVTVDTRMGPPRDWLRTADHATLMSVNTFLTASMT
jgi:hypothetical protein